MWAADSRQPSPSRPSPNLGTSQQDTTEHLPISRARDDSSNQLAHVSAIPKHSSLAPAPDLHGSTAQQPTDPLRPENLDPFERHPQQSPVPATTSHESLLSQQLTPPPHQYPPQPRDGSPGIHYVTQTNYESRNISVDGNMNHISYNYTNTVVSDSNDFMKELLEGTIPGAAFDSSARDPPPRCHPGTRLAILKQCLYFIVHCSNKKKMRWVVGAAGVGKSAIMQSVAEHPLASVLLRASIFFFVNGRNDGSKAIATLAYQLAVQSDPYRQFIRHEIAHDPSLLGKSLSTQFQKFVIQPFIHHPQLNSAGRVLIIIDGLDECNKSHTQRELLQLISDFCLTYPSSPVVWMIASRPEPHITSFFAQASVEEAYEKEEIPVDSDDAREDVERFLRIELTKIQNEFSLSHRVQWPSEQDFWKLANASGGLFVYAQTVTKYIGDRDIGDPIQQLNDVLDAIDAHPLVDIPSEEHPMALLDALYSRILSKVPTKVMKNTRKLLLALVEGRELFDRGGRNFIVLCNWLGMTRDEAYAAVHHLSSVLNVPGRDKAHKEDLRYFHKSFIDYISDFSRSGFSRDITHEAHQFHTQYTFRIIEQAPDGVDAGKLDYDVRLGNTVGTLTRDSSTSGNISLTWPVEEESGWDDNRTRLFIYKTAVASVADRVRRLEQAIPTVYIRFLTACFRSFSERGIPNLHEVVFDKSRRHEFIEQGLIQEIPARMLNFTDVGLYIQLHYRRPTAPAVNLPDPWNPHCEHRRDGEWGKGKDLAWYTHFITPNFAFPRCDFCRRRLGSQLENWKAKFPDHPVPVLFTSAGEGFVEFIFVDSEDGMSEWTYWLRHKFSEEEHRKLGSTV